MRKWFRDHGLTVVVLTPFMVFWLGQALTGWTEKNRENAEEEGEPSIGFVDYLQEGEFLQMAMYVIFTAFLYQRGSSESKDPDAQDDPVDRDPRHSRRADAPWPIRRGGLALGAMAILSIHLRHKGSPESKPADAPHAQTCTD